MEKEILENNEVNLFEEYENGKDIDELNAIIENGAENAEVKEDNSEENKDIGGAAEVQKPSAENTEVTKEEKTSQDNGDGALKSYLAKMLGCSENEVLDAVKKRGFELEAENAGVSDVDLFVKNKINEEELNRIKSEREFEVFKKEYINDITGQVNTIKESEPDFDMDALCENDDFVDAMNMFYKNGRTKEKAVLYAYNAVMFDKRLQGEKNKILQSIKSGKMRPVEGANAASENTDTIDINNITDDMLENLEKRALNGEEIVLV